MIRDEETLKMSYPELCDWLERKVADRDATIARLREACNEEEERAELHANINGEVAKALGLDKPVDGVWPSWHDLGQKVAQLRAALDTEMDRRRVCPRCSAALRGDEEGK